MSTIASQIICDIIVYSTLRSGADQRKHQSFASLAFVRGIHRWSVNSPHKGPVAPKMFPFDDVIMPPATVNTHVKTTVTVSELKSCSNHTYASQARTVVNTSGLADRQSGSWRERWFHGQARQILWAEALRIGRACPWSDLSSHEPDVQSTRPDVFSASGLVLSVIGHNRHWVLIHDDVDISKCLRITVPFLWGIRQQRVDSHHKGLVMRTFDVFFVGSLKNLFSRRSSWGALRHRDGTHVKILYCFNQINVTIFHHSVCDKFSLKFWLTPEIMTKLATQFFNGFS